MKIKTNVKIFTIRTFAFLVMTGIILYSYYLSKQIPPIGNSQIDCTSCIIFIICANFAFAYGIQLTLDMIIMYFKSKDDD